MLEGFLKGLEQPEYIHVLINPLPVYGLAMGLAALIIGLLLRSCEARTGAFALIFIAAASAWPVFHYGQQGYDRVKGMSDGEGRKWLEEHRRRGEQLIYVYYALGALALVSIGAEWKRPKAALPLAITTLVLATVRSASAATSPTRADTSGTKSSALSQRLSRAPRNINTTRIERGNYTGQASAEPTRNPIDFLDLESGKPTQRLYAGSSFTQKGFAKKPGITRDFHVSSVKIGKR